jgi:probable HAF family extracellular repeat protein
VVGSIGHAFRTAPNSAINPATDDLGTLGGSNSDAFGINNTGQVVGGSYTINGTYHAFRTAPNSAINPATDDLGTLGGESSYSYGINNFGQVVGIANTIDGYFHAFRTAPNSAINPATDDLGTLGGDWSHAYEINNSGQVVGSASTTNGPYHAFRTTPNGPINPATDDLGTLGGDLSTAFGINNAGQVVGYSHTTSNSAAHAFVCNSTGPMLDLNNLIDTSSGWTLQIANAINSKGQIVGYGINANNPPYMRGFLLTPVGKCESRQARTPVVNPIDCLRKWNNTTSTWDQVMPGDLSSKNVHVIVHGWGAGLREFTNNGGHIWNANDPLNQKPTNQDGYDMITDMATAINSKSSGDIVVAFDWLDRSATDSDSPHEAWKSRAEVDGIACLLKSSLDSACSFSTGFTGKLQLIGFSHGARVAAKATETLYNGGNSGSIVVNQLTLCDSPDNDVSGIPVPELKDWKIQWHGAENNLGDILKNLPIGRTPGTTFVDNYCSLLGVDYTVGNSIVNAQLYPFEHGGLIDPHGYAMDWYTGATANTNNVALAWSPLFGTGTACQTLDSKYYQGILNEYSLVSSTSPVAAIEGKIREVGSSLLATKGLVTAVLKGMNLTENSPAYWHSAFMMNDNDKTLEFSYQWVNAGDGDELTLWIDDEMRFVVAGNLSGTNNITTDIDISDLGPGSHILSVALNNYGSANASVNVTDFKLISYPHELVWAGLASGVWDNNITTNFTGSTSGKFIDDDIVTFDDTGSISAISISTEGVNPSNVWFLNTTAKDYTLTGGPINAVNLIVAGGGEVTIDSINCSKTILVTNGSTLTASSIVCSTLIIGGSNTLSAVPEPSMLILSFLGIPFAMIFWKMKK